MKKLASILALLLLPAFALGQTGAYSGHTFVGGTPATTSGMKSSNYLNGIIPGASITVYMTGSSTKATIYADGSNTPLSNPFFSNLASGTNPGGFIFWAATNQGLDIQAQGGMGNASCTTSPLCYPTATTLQVDVYPNNSFSISGGVTSLNSLTGALTLESTDSSVTITPSGTNINLQTTGGGGGGSVQYNPSTTAYYLASSSIMMDDNRTLSSAVAVSTWTCNGTTCTVNTSAAHGYSTGAWVDVSQMTGWAMPSSRDTWVSVFPVTVTSTTQFTFANSVSSSNSGGNVYLATYWGAYQIANAPYIKGHGTFTSFFSTAANLDTNFATSIVNCSAGTPTYLILQVGLNDVITGGASAGTVEGYLGDIMKKAHAAGCIVVAASLLNTHVGISDSPTFWQTVGAINEWQAQQGITSAGTTVGNSLYGKYWDRYIDFNSYGGASGQVGTDPSASAIVGQRVNEAFANQASSMNGPPPYWQPWTSNNIAFNIPSGKQLMFLFNYNPAVMFVPNTTFGPVITTYTNYNPAGDTIGNSNVFNFGLNTSENVGCNLMQTNESENNAAFRMCLNIESHGSATNFFSIDASGTTWQRALKIFSTGAIQLPLLVATSGTQPLVVDTAGNVGVGTFGGATTYALTAAASGGASPGSTFNGGAAVTFDAHSFGAPGLANTTNTFTNTLDDFSGVTQIKLPVAGGYASAANGEIGYDSTNLNWHIWDAGADTLVAVLPTSGISTGHCMEAVKSGNSWALADAGGACTTGGGGGTVSSGTAWSPTFYAATGTVVGGTTPFTGFEYWPGSGAPRAATAADLAPLLTATVFNWTVQPGTTTSTTLPILYAAHAGTISSCFVGITTTDPSTAFVFNIKQNGTSVLSGGAQTIAATTTGYVAYSLTSGSLSVTQYDTFTLSFTTIGSAWFAQVVCH